MTRKALSDLVEALAVLDEMETDKEIERYLPYPFKCRHRKAWDRIWLHALPAAKVALAEGGPDAD